MADRAKFLDFLDMIDGGGAGQRGNQFEGGGIFSALANLMPINPFGSEDPTRRRARDEFFGGLLSDGQQSGAISAAEAAATPAVTQRQRMSAAMADEARQRGLLQDALDPRGGTGASGFRNPMQGLPNMNMRPMAGVTTPAPAQGMPDMSMKPMAGVTTPMPDMPQNMARPMPQVGSMPAMPQNMARPEMGAGSMPANSEFANFLQMAKNDPMFAGMNAEALRNIYSMYKEQMAARQR